MSDYKYPIHLICDHCGQIVQTGISNVANHNLIDCPVYTTKELGNGFSARYRPEPSYTPIYKELDNKISL